MKSTTLSFVALLLAAPLVQAQSSNVNVVTLPFSGPGASVPREQLVVELCQDVKCVPQSKVFVRGRTDWKKVNAQDVALVVSGKVMGPAANRRLLVEVYDARAELRLTETYPLARNGKLEPGAVPELNGKIADLANAIAAPPQAPEAAPPPEAQPPPPEVAQTPAPAPAAPSAEAAAGKPPLVIAEAGLDLLRRNFQYSDLQIQNLRAYETQLAIVAPRLHLEVYPLTRFTSGITQGLGLEAEYEFAVGLKSTDENDVDHPTHLSRFDLAARWNLPVEVKGQPFTVAPILGYRSASFSVGPGPDGVELVGVPDVRYSALRVGGEAQTTYGKLIPFARLAYLHAFSLGELGSDAFFPDSTANGLEVQLGAGYRVLKPLEVRAGLHYTLYGSSFNPAPGAPHQASGATDQYLGLALTARYAW